METHQPLYVISGTNLPPPHPNLSKKFVQPVPPTPNPSVKSVLLISHLQPLTSL